MSPADHSGALPVSVSFVCQSGRLEMQALLLAASLRLAHPQLRLIAAVPDALPPATTAGLQRLGVTCLPIENPVAADYPIGHKVAALAAGAEGPGLRLFLDSDMLCLRPLDVAALGAPGLAAKPADLARFGDVDFARSELWQRLYARCGLPMPAACVAATVSGTLMPPYFNAGFIATTAPAALAPRWAELCRRIDTMQDVMPRRPWLDQLALPLAAATLGLEMRCLGERWNYPAHLRPVQDAPMLVHYHQPQVIAREATLIGALDAVLTREPWLAERLANEPGWSRVHVAWRHRRETTPQPRRWWPRRAPAASPPPADVLVSGIPRSGTSYLCRCLDAFDNAAVVNEPAELFEALRYAPDPWVVPLLHADLRAAIDAGEAVRNKLDASGGLTEDTAVAEHCRDYRPRLRDRAWVLASKNTLAYMARLEGLLRLMPHARVVLCVRHPADTLASWKGTFAHLASGDPQALPVGGPQDPYLPAAQRAALADLTGLPHPAWRRAAWWRLLADEVLRWRGHPRVVCLRYEDLVSSPQDCLQRALGPYATRAGSPQPALTASTPRSRRRAGLDEEDWRALQALCLEPAERLGYGLDGPGFQAIDSGRSPVPGFVAHG